MRCIFLDVDGVLVHGYNADPEKSVKWDRYLERDFGVLPEDFRRQFVLKSFASEVLPGKRSLADALEETLPGLGYTGDVQPFIRYWLENDTNVDAQLLQTLGSLIERDGLRLFVATNQEHERASYLWTQLGLGNYFEDMFYAARIGAKKPDVKFFEHIESVIDFGDKPPLLFDDDPRVVEIANALGWEAVRYEHIRDFREHEVIRALQY